MRAKLLGLLLMAVMGANGDQDRLSVIAIHVEGTQNVNILILHRAKSIADSLFDSAGIRVVWKAGTPRPADSCCAVALVLDLTTSTPANFKPDALAYAFPYRGTASEIDVFYDR